MRHTPLILGASALTLAVATFGAGAWADTAGKAAKNDPSNVTQTEIDQRIASSKASIQTLAQGLAAELEAAAEKGGPLNALDVCNTKAAAIAQKLSAEQGMKLSRVSLKNRNVKNAAEGWTKTVLTGFETRFSAGEGIDKMEHHEVVEVDGKREFRFMKAIPIRSACLGCHGTEIKPEVQAKITELYPSDKATGYKTGDLRGAFVVVQPF
ncbi:MAG: DUF3365 domain-containing protein [Thiotrichales bacterium]